MLESNTGAIALASADSSVGHTRCPLASVAATSTASAKQVFPETTTVSPGAARIGLTSWSLDVAPSVCLKVHKEESSPPLWDLPHRPSFHVGSLTAPPWSRTLT